MQHKVLIVEDEFPIAMDLESRLSAMGFDISAIAVNYAEAVAAVVENKPDIAILDINLEEEKSGIDLGALLNSKFDLPFIYLTAYNDDETYLRAAETEPMAFLNKPFKDELLKRTLELAIKQFDKIRPTENRISPISTNSIFIKDKGKFRKIDLEKIHWIEAMDNYTNIHLEKERFVVNDYLSSLIEKLGDKFIRIHRSHAVAIDHITGIEDNLVYIGNKYLTVSKSYKSDLLEKLNLL